MVRTTMEVNKSTLEILKKIGKKNQTYDLLIKQRIRCNRAGCDNTGSVQINAEQGNFGSLTLFVCSSCVGKFQNEH